MPLAAAEERPRSWPLATPWKERQQRNRRAGLKTDLGGYRTSDRLRLLASTKLVVANECLKAFM